MTQRLLTADEISQLAEDRHRHQFNHRAIRNTRSIGDLLGLTRMGVHLVRVEPGRETTEYHFHHHDEEFLYILSGRGIAEIGQAEYEVAAGDFLAFPQHSEAHTMQNPSDTDLVYLMGGTRGPVDICDYPRKGTRMYRVNGERVMVDLDEPSET